MESQRHSVAHDGQPKRVTGLRPDPRVPGNVVVEIHWPDDLPVDVDLWVQAPRDVPVGYWNQGSRFFNLLRAGFSEPRKQLHNVLSAAFGIPDLATLELLEAAGIAPADRAQHLDLPRWRALFDAVERRHPRMLDV